MKKTYIIALGLFGISALFSACSKQPLDHINAEESRIYITDHDSTINFKNYSTFSISDSVANINNGKSTQQLNATDAAYLNSVKEWMQQMGYVLVNKTTKPDLGVNVNRIISTSTGVISYGDYWNYYGGYWDPYYWGYPGYGYYMPYAYATYQIREGAISVDILDLKDASSTKKINVIWTGLIRGSGIYNAELAQSQIQALFNQSPYLKIN